MNSVPPEFDPNPLISLFRSCVVRIDSEGGKFLGTGFFVAPGRVVTCGHVVHGAAGLRIWWQGRFAPVIVSSAVPALDTVADARSYPLPDLAMLNTGPEAVDWLHPCVLLAGRQPILAGSSGWLYLAGYTVEHGPDPVLTGAATKFETIVSEGPDTLYKFTQGLIMPGFSGAPLLDAESGAVTGIVESSRSRSSDLGGFAVPSTALTAAFPGLADANRDFYAHDPRWSRAEQDEKTRADEREVGRGRLGLRTPVVELPADVEVSAATVLRPRHAVVGYVGREQLLADLADWCEREPGNGQPVQLWLVTGGGGYGKTRLAVQACLEAEARGWTAGLLPLEVGDARLEALAEWRGRLLIAIDYAETRPDLIRRLVEELAARPGRPPVRIMLLVRQRAARAQLMTMLNEGRDDYLGVLLAQAQLSRLDESADEVDRLELFRRAMRDFGRLAGAREDAAEVPRLRARHFARPLYVLTAAYLTRKDISTDVDALSETGLLRTLIDEHEADHWDRWSRRLQLNLDRADQRAAVALATLLTATSDAEALTVARLIPHLGSEPEARLIAIARWLAQLYPAAASDSGQLAIAALEPDRLGEVLAGDVLYQHPDMLSAAMDAATDRQLTQVLTATTRIARDDQGIRDQLRGALDERLADLLQRALTDSSGELLTAVSGAMTLSRPASGAIMAADRLPSVLPIWLHPLAAAITQLATDGHRARAELDPEATPELARSLSNLGNRLSQAGRRDEALTATTEAVTTYRQLADTNPAAHLPDLAASLNNLGVRLSQAGRRDEALTATTEAVTTYRQLADTNPAAYLPDLAASLNNLGVRLSEAGRRDEALTATTEAVTTYRQLADTNPAAYLPDLAASLNNLGVRLSEAGRRDEALTATTEAVTTYRQLADTNPAAYLPDLAASLNNLGVRLSEAGRRDEALTATTEAVTIRRQLADTNPAAYLPDLAASLNNLGEHLSQAGRRDEALTATTEAVTIRRQLADTNPAAYLPDLAASLNNLGEHLSQAGRRDEALTATTEAVTTYRQLADTNPAAYLPDLAASLNNLGEHLSQAGRRDEALTATTEAVTTYRQLADTNPAAYLPDLAASLNNLGNRLSQAGRRDEALTATTEAVTTYRQLADTNPAAYLPDLAASLNNLGEHLSQAGRRDEALTATTEAVTIRRQLADTNPAAYLPDLAASLNNLGEHLSQAGRRDEALTATTEAVTIRRQLADTNPAAYLPDLAASLNNLGEHLSQAGRRDEALTATTEAATIRRQLADTNPAAHLPDLAMSLNNLGEHLSQAGRRDEALTATTEAATIRRQLADTNPAAHLPDLAMSLNNLGNRLSQAGRHADAERWFGELVDTWASRPAGAGHLLLARGRWLIAQGRLAEALADLASTVAAFENIGDLRNRGRARSYLRALRQDNPEPFDSAWGQLHESLPIWLQFPDTDDSRTATIIAWIRTPDWGSSRDYLDEHSAALLCDEAEAELEHLIDANPDLAELREHLRLLHAARTRGTGAAYAAFQDELVTTRLTGLLHAWIRTPTWTESQQFATTHAHDLLSSRSSEILDRIAALNPANHELRLHRGLLSYAVLAGTDAAYQLRADAHQLLAALDTTGPADTPIAHLALARLNSGLRYDDPHAHFRLTTASLLAGNADEAAAAVTECADNAAPYERRDFTQRLGQLAADRPHLASLIADLQHVLRGSPQEAVGDNDVTDTISAWISTPTWDDSESFLTSHSSELLTSSGQAFLRVLAARNSDNQLDLHLNLLTAAIRDGIPAAYTQLRAGLAQAQRARILNEWLSHSADPAASAEYLTEHASDLLDSSTIAMLASACDREPGNLGLWKHLGLLLLGEHALQAYTASDESSSLARAESAFEAGELDEAFAWSCLARAADPGPGALFMATIQMRRGDLTGASQALATAADQIPIDRFDAVLAAYEDLLAADPGQPWWHAGQASALSRAGQPEAAVAAYDQALSLAPDDPSLHFNKGHLLFGLSRFDEAHDELIVVRRLRPEDVLGAAVLLAAIAWPDTEKVAGCFQAALDSPGNRLNPTTRAFYRAVALTGLGQTDEAIAELKTAIRPGTEDGWSLDEVDQRVLDRFSSPPLPGLNALREVLRTSR